MDRTSELLQQLGLSRNEARAYVALLSCQPASAYEIAKQSAIPSSKIYETVNRLVLRGVIRPAGEQAEAGKQYIALPPADFMAQLREAAMAQTRELEPRLASLGNAVPGDLIWPLATRESIAAKALELIASATDNILISAWPEELAWLIDALQAAEAKGVRIALVHFGPPAVRVGATYHHPVEKTLYTEKGGRGLTIVVDSNAVVIANFRASGEVDGAWSRNQSFVTVAEDYVKHDVYITKVTRFLDGPLKARFGAEYERLRDVFDADA